MPEASRRAAFAVAFVVGVAAGCEGVVADEVVGVDGLAGVLRFSAPTDLAFSEAIGVGSQFAITARHIDSDVEFADDADVAVSSDKAVVELVDAADDAVEFNVVINAGGTFRLAITEGAEVVDRIDLRAVPIAESVLVDTSMLAFAVPGDVTRPVDFAYQARDDLKVSVAAIDRCNNGVLDLGASTVVVDEGFDVAVVGDGSFVVSGDADGEFHELTLQTPGLAPLTYNVLPVGLGAVDEIDISLVAADGSDGSFTAWGRAFVDGVDVVGVEDFTWSSDPRVSLNNAVGPVITGIVGDIPQNPDGTPGDDAATIAASALGEDVALDLLSITTDDALVGSRGPGPERADDDDDEEEAAIDDTLSCGGCGDAASACDPLAVAVPMLGLRRFRRRRR